MKKCLIPALLATILAVLTVGCGKEPENVYTYSADLTHDGTDETIEVNVADILLDNQQPAVISIYNNKDKVIWQTDLWLPHSGWSSYYLVEWQGQDYILYYLPELSQGQAYYEYRLFWLDEQGNLQVADTGELSFVTWSAEGDVTLPTEDILAFGEKINPYLENGILLVDTVNLELRYSTPETPITDKETFDQLLQ